MRIFALFGVCVFAFGCATSGSFTRAKTAGKVISPSETKTTSSGTQKLVPNKVTQINKVPNGLTSPQQVTVESYDANTRNFEDPPKGATLLNQANHRNIAQNFSSKSISKNDSPKSNEDIIKPIDMVRWNGETNNGVKVYWFRLILFYLVIAVIAWFIYSSLWKKKAHNPFNSSENPFSEKAPQDKNLGGGI